MIIVAVQLSGQTSALTLLAFGQDGLLQPLAQSIRQLVQLMAAINLNSLASGVHRDHAMLAAAQMLFEVSL